MHQMPRRAGMARLPLLSMAASLALAGLLGGCAQAPKPLYDWGGYPAQSYAYLKGDGSSPSTQLGELEADAQKIESRGGRLPPGFHAHLGLLYQSIGQDDLAQQQLKAEKDLYPEASHFMDFLLARSRRGESK